MTRNKQDGGPAFPATETHEYFGEHGFQGMSLRDCFAWQALGGLPQLCAHDTLWDGITFPQHVARNAYEIADAMIAERNKQ